MMKIITKLLIIFMCAICLSTEVYAESCPNSVKRDLAQKAAYIKTEYEILDNSSEKELVVGEDKTTYIVPNYTFKISIYNIKKDFKVEVKNTYNNESFVVTNADTVDDIYTFEDKDIVNIYNYEMVITSNSPDCTGVTFKTLKFTKPRYNAYSGFLYCQNSSNYYCQKFVTNDLKIESTEDFLNKIKVNNRKPNTIKEDGESKDIKEIIKNNWKLYVKVALGIIIIVLIIIISYKIIKKKKRGAL